MSDREIKTVGELVAAIKQARLVHVSPRFGTWEGWVRITKGQAALLVSGLYGSPADHEMYSGSFGHVDEEGDLYLG